MARWMVGGLACALLLARVGAARACAGTTPPTPQAVAPPEGKTDVSPASSIIVVSGFIPQGLVLTANGAPVALPLPGERGGFFPTGGTLYTYQLPNLLDPDTDYVLSGPDPAVQPPDPQKTVELLHFHTAPAYDKLPGTAPTITLFKLWRVRYPLGDIASGNCVFAEYQGYLQLAFDPASFPHTAPRDILYTLSIRPRTGGSSQGFSFRGDRPYEGYDKTNDPMPLSPALEWPIELDPTREYCAALGAQGDGDIARLGVGSKQVCAKVVQLSAPGAPPSPIIVDPAVDGGVDSGAQSRGACPGTGSGSGCSASGRRGSGSGMLWLALLGLAAGVRRRRL